VTDDIAAFVGEAGGYLSQAPVDHSALLTEAAYLQALPAMSDGRFGWWREAGQDVSGAYVQAPRHLPVLSRMSRSALAELTDPLAGAERVGLDARDADDLVAAWGSRGVGLHEAGRIAVLRLGGPVAPPDAGPDRGGRARTADRSDAPMLTEWFGALMAGLPDDASDLAYVVGDPLTYGGITVWEVDGRPVAMAGRSRLVAGMVRLGPVFAPGREAAYERAAFAAACVRAREIASDVLVFTDPSDQQESAALRRLGFDHVAERVILTVVDPGEGS
jgi:hypothetical protein